MADNYEHQNDPLNTYVIRDLLINHLPEDFGWCTVRDYVDWGSEYHLSHGGDMPKSNVYGNFYRALEKFVLEGLFEKSKDGRKSYYNPIRRDKVEVLLEVICDTHDNLFQPISFLDDLISAFEGLVAIKSELEKSKAELEAVSVPTV